MRILPPLVALLLLLTLPAALAHHAHGACASSRSFTLGHAHVDVYRSGGCAGATVRVGEAVCLGEDPHLVAGVHTPILYRRGCETGAVVEPLSAGLLP